MDSASSTYSILDTLRTVEFRLGLKGYNVDEVDEYLEKAALEAEQVQERLRTANERLVVATERVAQLEEQLEQSSGDRTAALEPSATEAPAPASGHVTDESAVTSDALQRTFVLAQKFVDQTKRESEAQAAKVVSEAEDRARTLLAQAEERARIRASEAEERLRDEVARLEEARTRLASDLDAMSGHLEEQRTKIRVSLTEMLRWVDEQIAGPATGEAETAAEVDAPERSDDSGPTGEVSGTVDAGAARSPQSASAGSLVSAAAGTTTPPASSTPSSAHGRQSSVSARAHAPASPSDRTRARVRADAGVANGGLFEVGREEASGPSGRRLGE